MSRAAVLLVVALGALRSEPCGTETTAAGVNGACTRTSDCDKGLSCVDGVCSLPGSEHPSDAGTDGDTDASDTGAPDGNAAD